MKVLFEFSRSGLPEYKEFYELIRETILQAGHKLTNDLIKDTEKYGYSLPEGVYPKITESISESECVIIEGTFVSLSLGYILTDALNLGKPVLFLSHKDRNKEKNRFVDSIKTKILITRTYSDVSEVEAYIKDFFKGNEDIKTRFNLVLPNKINSYVTDKSRQFNISKTEYIINLIISDMTSNGKENNNK